MGGCDLDRRFYFRFFVMEVMYLVIELFTGWIIGFFLDFVVVVIEVLGLLVF